MKNSIIFIPLFILLTLSTELRATFAVVDYSQITMHLSNAKRDLIEQLRQEANQRLHISKTLEQIKQIDVQLKRMGDPGNVDLDALKELYDLVRDLPLTKTTKELGDLINDNYLFEVQDHYAPITRNMKIGDEDLGQRDVSSFRSDLIARRSFSEYHNIKEAALVRRRHIARQLETTMRQLESATTTSEVQKLQMVISTLNAQYAAITQEIDLAATEASTRFFQNEVEARMQKQARLQDQRAAHIQAMRKNLQTFRLPNTPILFKK